MSSTESDAVPKIHPATREMLATDPFEMHGFEVSGDADLMLRLLVEEYARMGWGLENIMALARDPNYRAFYGLLQQLGEVNLRDRIADILSRCGVMRVKTVERHEPQQLVQIELNSTHKA